MKKAIFLAHDPGGADVIWPVFDRFPVSLEEKQFWAIGPAGERHKEYQKEKTHVLDNLTQMLRENKIQLLVTGTSWGDHTECYCIKACHEHGVKTISILDYWSNYANRFKVDSGEYIWPDAYLVMDELAREEAIADGVPERLLHITGHPGLDRYAQQRDLMRHDKRTRLGNVLFLSQPLFTLYGMSLGYNEYTVTDDLKEMCEKLKLKLSIKFHPKDTQDFCDKYGDLKIDGDLDDLMVQFDCVVGMSTMGLLHAVLLGVPVISYQPGLIGNDGCITNRLQVGSKAYRYDDLYEILQSEKYIRKGVNIESGVRTKWMDGQSTHRAVEAVKEVLGV